MNSSKKFLILSGPSCAGKTTILEKILDSEEGFYKLSYDSQKWLFSKYDRTVHARHVEEVVEAIAEKVCGLGYHIVSDAGLQKKYREDLLKIPTRYGYEIIEINLEARYETLLARFRERIALAMANPEKKISNTSEERFREIYDTYLRERNPSAPTFDTGVTPNEEVYKEIVSLLALPLRAFH